jgi:hypothetical protein
VAVAERETTLRSETKPPRCDQLMPFRHTVLCSAVLRLRIGVLCGWTAAAPTDRAEWRAVVCVWLGGGQQARRVSGG